ncbi:MAG: TonB-dependent receptor [Bacteroidota bacterium]
MSYQRYKYYGILLIVLIAYCLPLSALPEPEEDDNESMTISGYVKSADDGEMLPGATVVVQGTARGTATNAYGFFSISLPEGDYVLEVGFLGYETHVLEVSKSREVNIELQSRSETIDEVVVTGDDGPGASGYPMMGVEQMKASSISKMPVLMGETDPMKAVQMLPGVTATSEGSSSFTVRGGNPDQNLLLMDEAIVYNGGHLLGFFSIFNNDAVKSVDLYKGDFPASEGGRLSSVMDVRMREGNMKEFSGKAGVGLISSRLTLEGPIKKDEASFLLSGRRSYLDVFLPLAPDESIRDHQLFFYDTNLKVNWIAGEKNRFFLSGYLGRDAFSTDLANLDFGNHTFTFRWNHVFSPSLFANFTLVRSRYDYFLGSSENDFEDMEWRSELNDNMAESDFTWYISHLHTLRFGARSIYHRIEPGHVSGLDENSLLREVDLPRSHSLEHGAYVSYTGNLAPWLSLRLGMRYSLFQNIGPGKSFDFNNAWEVTDTLHYDRGEVYNWYDGLEPRAGLSVSFNPRFSGRASYSRTRQYLQLASNSTTTTPLDVWFPASPNIKPQIADQVSFGASYTSRNGVFEHSIEFFNKWMQNTIDFKEHPDLILNEAIEGEARVGRALSRGVEWMTNWNTTRFNGWIGYTLSKSERVAPEINEGRPYLSPYDHTHDFSVYMDYQISPKWSFSGNWVYYTGAPVTMPVGRYEVGGEIIPLYSERNAERMPDYHRLDLSVTLSGNKGKNKGGEWVFSLYNVYGRKNAWAINFVNDDEDPYKIRAEKTYLFSIVPSISYTLKF